MTSSSPPICLMPIHMMLAPMATTTTALTISLMAPQQLNSGGRPRYVGSIAIFGKLGTMNPTGEVSSRTKKGWALSPRLESRRLQTARLATVLSIHHKPTDKLVAP